MDYEIPTSTTETTEHHYDDVDAPVYSQISQEHEHMADTTTGKGRRWMLIYFSGLVITSCVSAVAGYYSGHMLVKNELFSCLSWSHWTNCTFQQQNRTRIIPVCENNLCIYKLDYETRKCEEKDSSGEEDRSRLSPSSYLCMMNESQCLLKGYKIDTNVRLNRSSLYKDMYISSDNLMISNVLTANTTQSEGIGFKRYKGVMADRCVKTKEVMTFEVQYDFHITTTLTGKGLVFQVGIAELDKIDKSYLIGDSKVEGFSFNVYKKYKYTGLVAANSTNQDVINPEFSRISNGTVKHGTLFFSIDRLSDTFSILENHQVLYTFTNVTSSVPLCPVFGLFNPHRVNAMLRLVYTTYMRLSK